MPPSRFLSQNENGFRAWLHDYEEPVEVALKKQRDRKIMSRIWEKDHTVWKPDPTEISNRLGWLHSPEAMIKQLGEIETFVDDVRRQGFTHALLLGMGGSSLAPEVFRFTFGVKPGYLDLSVLDSTDPGAVLAREHELPLRKTLFVVSTKSGGTVETLSFFKYFYNRILTGMDEEKAGGQFVAITDPGSKLVEIAKQYAFRKVFLNDPNIGGRYSALSFFGLVPAALIGMDVRKLLERAQNMADNCRGDNCPAEGDNSGAWLGSIMGELAKAGRDKVTFVASPAVSFFGAWAEQLIAESTGKEGTGILPVDLEVLGPPENYAEDRLFVNLRLKDETVSSERLDALRQAGHPVVEITLQDPYDLGAEFFRWELATSVAGHQLGINPFDQPDVESAKVLAREMVAAYQKQGTLPKTNPSLTTEQIEVFSDGREASVASAMQGFLGQLGRDVETTERKAYVSIHAYVNPTKATDAALNALRLRIRDKFSVATTVGYGPRFLHSTGQLHKGDAGRGLFIQITADDSEDMKIPNGAGAPESAMTFGVLKLAQALGDLQALREAGRKAIRFHLRQVGVGLNLLEETL